MLGVREMENQISELILRIDKIEERNRRVEADKAWEISKTRIILICILTYIIAVAFMKLVNTKNVILGALIPVIGFYLSTQSLKMVKDYWLKRNGK